jgi:hypothetical protein
MAGVPSADQYERAFRSLRIAGALPKTHRKLLQAHYCAPACTATATELAAKMGFASYSAVNLHYGTFGAISQRAWAGIYGLRNLRLPPLRRLSQVHQSTPTQSGNFGPRSPTHSKSST